MSKRILFVGLLAVGLMAASAGTASAQFVIPFGQPGAFGNSFGAVYPTPSGGIVQKYGYTDPFTGGTYLNKTYSNPFTGVVANQRYFQPAVSPFYPALYRPPVYFNYSYNRIGFNNFGFPGYNYGYSNFGYNYRYFR